VHARQGDTALLVACATACRHSEGHRTHMVNMCASACVVQKSSSTAYTVKGTEHTLQRERNRAHTGCVCPCLLHCEGHKVMVCATACYSVGGADEQLGKELHHPLLPPQVASSLVTSCSLHQMSWRLEAL